MSKTAIGNTIGLPGHECAVLIPVGPSEEDVGRVQDLVDSITEWEPAVTGILLVDDATVNRLLPARIQVPGRVRFSALPNPRRGTGYGYFGGLCAGVLRGLQWIDEHWGVEFALKVDTDALVIGPFAAWLGRAATKHPSAGLFGSVGVTCNKNFYSVGSERFVWSPIVAALDSDEFWTERNSTLPLPPPFLDGQDLLCAQRRGFALLETHVRSAIAHGYHNLHFCQGGAYAVSRRMIKRMQAMGCFDSAEAWIHIPIWEDVIVGMYAYAAGLTIYDGSGLAAPFGCQWSGLAHSPDDMIATGYGLIHSLKGNTHLTERAVRRYFAAHRTEHREASRTNMSCDRRTSKAVCDGHPAQGVTFYAQEPESVSGGLAKPIIAVFAGAAALQSFGELSQILSVLSFYRQNRPDCTVVLVAAFREVVANGLAREWALANETDVILYTHSPLPRETLVRLQLKRLHAFPLTEVFHAAGDAAAEEIACCVEAHGTLDKLLGGRRPQKYVLSGISGHWANGSLSLHIARLGPLLVGCRDSCAFGRLSGLPAQVKVSGSDALDVFLALAQACGPERLALGEAGVIAFQASLRPRDIYGRFAAVDPIQWRDAFGVVEAALDTIGPNGLAISTKKVTTDDYCDTSSVLEHTHVPRRFRSSTVVGLAHYALGNRLAKAVDVIASEKVTRVACTSFHTHALFRVLGIPSFRLPIRCGGDVSAGGMTSETRRRVIRGFEKFVQAPVEWLREEMSEEVRRDIQDRRAWTEVLRNSVGRVVSEGNAPAC